MLMRFWLYCLFTLLCFASYGQSIHPFLSSDTIKADHRIGGKLDSIDIMFGTYSSTLPGGSQGFRDNILRTNWMRQMPGGQRFYGFGQWSAYRYSGIPHVGFAYSFGSQGTQLVRSEYEQGFKGNVMLNIDFQKERSNGFLRNGVYNHDNVQLKLFRKGQLYSGELKGSYEKSAVGMNGGIATDSLADEFSLIFIPVKKETAEFRSQRSRLQANNYFDFNKDSTKSVGMYTTHGLSIKHGKFTETGDLASIYPVINYDSNTTYDQFQWSQVENGGGVFLRNNYQFLKLGAVAQFWNFQNLGRYYDTVEIDLQGLYNLKRTNLVISDELNVNFVGANGEIQNDLKASYKFDELTLLGSFYYHNKLPDYYQRFALGNNYFPVSQLEKQRMTDIEIGGKYPIGKHEAGLNYEYVSCVNNYWFVDSVWTKDILNSIQYHSISARASFNFGAWHVQPEYIFTHDRFVLNIIPFHQLRTRIFVKGGIFKARKLIGYAGLDFSAVSSYTWKGFNYFNASFALKNNGLGGVGWTNLHVFGGFQIDEFKFYFRVENLGYIWNDRNLELQSGFPIPSTQFRLGVTWDFFN